MELSLRKLEGYTRPAGPLLLIIMDGYGIGREYDGNAVFRARKPHLDRYFSEGLYTQLRAHGPAVGLPSDDDMGNSEVGHNALGAGRIFAQGAKLVNRAIEDGSLFETELWRSLIDRHADAGTLHFIGLLSDGNVHSHIDHLFAMIDRAATAGVRRLRVHTLLDGRDVDEKSALRYLEPLEHRLDTISREYDFDYRIASGGGRMNVTMDRYNADWRIVKRGYDAHVLGVGRGFASASEAVNTFYGEDPEITDQYLDAFVIVDDNGPVGRILDGDSVIFFNFRGDRAIEISRALTEAEFHEFDRGPLPDITYAGMMEYDGDLHIPARYLVNPPSIDRTIGQYLCAAGVRSFAVSETQKFGHVTYFWNGNNSGYIDAALEQYVEIPSDRIEFDKAPKMKAKEIADASLQLLDQDFSFGRINLANGDMVGHSGRIDPAIVAIETVDEQVGRLVEKIRSLNGTVIITADHGNSDEMFTEKDGVRTPKTSHTLNPVPFCILGTSVRDQWELADVAQPGLANVAATILNLLGFEKPADYEPSLIRPRNG
ncbi:MAG: 2,3-bisphosphoglycerate-independent phosphoglycerate mutase [Bacteroidota bacterium]|jgi:2,3-bisphosphoglycerate-independent phosphoglycerate mutase|nr:2,3-bisphosphoglycerate-independent phosphoglycerate mutase [Bacteroidota bacterium]